MIPAPKTKFSLKIYQTFEDLAESKSSTAFPPESGATLFKSDAERGTVIIQSRIVLVFLEAF